LFNANSVFEFIDLSGLSLDKLVTIQSEDEGHMRLTLRQAQLLVYCGLKEAALEEKGIFTMTVRDVGKLFDPLPEGAEVLKNFLELFDLSKDLPDVPLEPAEEDSEGKK